LSEAHTIVADALEEEAALQESGAIERLGDAYDPTYARVIAIDPDYSEAIAFAFTFWDQWTDAANHHWHYHEPVTEGDWPRFAREIASAVRRGHVPDNEFLVDQVRLKPRRTFGQWLRGLFGRTV